MLEIWPLDVCGIESNDEIGMLIQDLQILVWNSLLEKKQHFIDNKNLTKKLTNNLYNKSFYIHPIIYSYFIHNRPNSYFKFKVVFTLNFT